MTNKEYHRKYHKQWEEKNKETLKKYKQMYYQTHRDEILKKAKAKYINYRKELTIYKKALELMSIEWTGQKDASDIEIASYCKIFIDRARKELEGNND